MKYEREILHLFVGLLVAWAGISVVVIDQLYTHIKEMEPREPKVIYYQVDSYGGAWYGKVTKKETTETGYTIEVGTYGRFLVTKEQYDAIKVGDPAPEFLKKRGS